MAKGGGQLQAQCKLTSEANIYNKGRDKATPLHSMALSRQDCFAKYP